MKHILNDHGKSAAGNALGLLIALFVLGFIALVAFGVIGAAVGTVTGQTDSEHATDWSMGLIGYETPMPGTDRAYFKDALDSALGKPGHNSTYDPFWFLGQ